MEHFDTPHTHHCLAIDVTDELAAELTAASVDDLLALARCAPQPRARAALRPCPLCTSPLDGSSAT